MLAGRFGGTTGRPYIEAFVWIPSLRVRGAVSFLVDTGADSTVLMQLDAIRLNIDYASLTETRINTGIGGNSTDWIVPATILFSEPRVKIYGYDITLTIVHPKPELETCPSLLGRDIINKWRMVYDPPANSLKVEVLRYDQEYPLS
jgi:hypothetical protein